MRASTWLPGVPDSANGPSEPDVADAWGQHERTCARPHETYGWHALARRGEGSDHVRHGVQAAEQSPQSVFVISHQHAMWHLASKTLRLAFFDTSYLGRTNDARYPTPVNVVRGTNVRFPPSPGDASTGCAHLS
jgi:hypothetical protein